MIKNIEQKGIETVTQKFTINDRKGPCDVYVIASKPVKNLEHIDVVLSGSCEASVRALVELACKNARLLLLSSTHNVYTLASSWRGYEFEPKGACPQLARMEGVENSKPVKSVLDLVGRYIQYLCSL